MNEMIGQAEFLRQPHFHERLAIALGVSTAEVAFLTLGEVFPLLMADEHDLDVVEVGQAGDDGLVVAQGAVAVQLEELLEDQVDVVAGLRAAAGGARPGRSARARDERRSRA